MSTFQKDGKKGIPELNTSSLPDLIFSVLFFFMIVTSMRQVELRVQFKLPKGTELEKLERKSLVSYIYIGPPTKEYRAKFGSQSRIQLNDQYAEPDAIHDFIQAERESLAERDKPFMKVSLKVDVNTQMGIISDVKMALRKAWALNLIYSAMQRQ